MDNSEQPAVKAFVKKTEVLPFTKYGISTAGEFMEAEADIRQLEKLKKIGLSDEEIKLYKDHEAGVLEGQTKIEESVLKQKLDDILARVNNYKEDADNSTQDAQPSSNTDKEESGKKSPTTSYPSGHPMNDIKQLEDNMFSNKKEDSPPLSKRRKILRHLERRQQELDAAERKFRSDPYESYEENRNGHSLWDKKKVKKPEERPVAGPSSGPSGSKERMYTIKDNKIVRLEPAPEAGPGEEYRAVDIVLPVNEAETQLLEGTKVSVDNIRKIDRFKDYEPGIPSKVLYLKNLDPNVTQEKVSLLFNQFVMDNGGPVEVRLMTGRMRGQAFIRFNHDHVSIQALEEINGTVLLGRPIIAEFGRNSNRIQLDDDR